MFVFSAKCPPLGMEVKIETDIPAFDLVPHQVRLRCIGRVSRVETCYQLSGFAVAGQLVDETHPASPFHFNGDRQLIAGHQDFILSN
jgi:hypothetical protein